MQEAVYFPSSTVSVSDFRHYGLASDIYTHFTSPIRRYPDVLVHRMLAHAIGEFYFDSSFENINQDIKFMDKKSNTKNKNMKSQQNIIVC